MKKFYYLFTFTILLNSITACNSDEDTVNLASDDTFAALLQNMEVYGKKSTKVQTKFNSKLQRPNDWENDNKWHPNMNDDKWNKDNDEWPENWEDEYMGSEENSFEKAYFFIRLDGNIITDHGLNSSKLYYPQTSTGASYYGELNKGLIETDLSNTSIIPAQWNYHSYAVKKYIYSSNGSATNEIIVETPDISRWTIDGKPIDTDKYHVIWYIVKLQSDGWHVDGILTAKDVTEIPEDNKKENEELEDTKVDPTPTPGDDEEDDDKEDGNNGEDDDNTPLNGEVEFDIHQQEHQNWNEIKTTVHLRDTVNVRIFIPIDGEYIAVADDFDIRIGDKWGNIEEKVEVIEAQYQIEDKLFSTNIYVTHKQNGIEILIEGNTCREALKLARKHYNDGITFEIHNYVYSSITTEEVWSMIKETECAQTAATGWPDSGDYCTHTYGQITSAYFPTEKVTHEKNPE